LPIGGIFKIMENNNYIKFINNNINKSSYKAKEDIIENCNILNEEQKLFLKKLEKIKKDYINYIKKPNKLSPRK
jgi:hypothetical protein